jgi:hypothetical protein
VPFVTLTLAQITDLLATQFSASPDVLPANTDAGSSLGAIFNADGLLMLFVQNELVYVDSISRLSTSNGDDVDTFCQPFGVYRLGPTPSSGGVTCSTPSPVSGSPLIVPVGGVVVTSSGLQFTIVADESNPDYNAGDAGYPIAIGDSSTTVSVVCTVAGSIGNVVAGQINAVFGSSTSVPITGISTVSNAEPFTNGINQESDADYKARFTLIVSSGRVATQNAILGAIASVEAGLTYSLGDRINPDGSTHLGFFSVIVNVRGQNTGPSGALLSAVTAAVEAVRSAGISYVVQGPTLDAVTASGTVTILPGFVSMAVLNAVAAAYAAYVNAIGLDPAGGTTTLSFGKTYAALLTVPGVGDIDDLLLNGAVENIVAPFATQIVAGTATFTAA